jgi:hypothetical protein
VSHIPLGSLSLPEQETLRVLATRDEPLSARQVSRACPGWLRPWAAPTLRRLAGRRLVEESRGTPTRYVAAPEWWLRLPPADPAHIRRRRAAELLLALAIAVVRELS